MNKPLLNEIDRLTAELTEARRQATLSETEIRQGDYWQLRATEALEYGRCPVCFATDEVGHTKGCPWGQAELTNERLRTTVRALRNEARRQHTERMAKASPRTATWDERVKAAEERYDIETNRLCEEE